MLIRLPATTPSAAAWQLYESAFPRCERRSAASHRAAVTHETVFHADELRLRDGGDFAGILYYWQWPEYSLCFVEHLAVQPELRGRGIGHAALELLRGTADCVLLEIEPVVDEQTARRLSFYRSAGFEPLPYEHVQLPYHVGDAPVPMVLLSRCASGAAASAAQVALLEKLLHEQVMLYVER